MEAGTQAAGSLPGLKGRDMRAWAIVAVVLIGCATQSADTLYLEAQALRSQGKPKEALRKIDLGIAREPSWRFRLLQADILLTQGKPEEVDHVLHTLPAPTTVEDRARVAMLQGQASFSLSAYGEAEGQLAQAEKLARQVSSPLLNAEIALRRGTLSWRQDKLAESEQQIREALRIAHEIGDARLEAIATRSLGGLLGDSYRCDAAIYWLEHARAAFERLGSATDAGRTAGGLGWCTYRLGDLDRAAVYLRQAEASAQASGNRRDEQSWLGDLASVAFDAGDVAGAAAAFRKALTSARELKEGTWVRHWSYSLANALIELGDVEGAERSNLEAAAVERELDAEKKGPRADLFIPVNAARIEVLRGNLDHAETQYRDMLSRPSDDPTPLLNAHSDLAQLLAKRGKAVEADQEYRRTLAQISGTQAHLTQEDFRLSYLSSLIEFCDRYVNFLVKRGETDRALEVTESIRARVLHERASQPGSGTGASVAALEQAARSSGSVFLSYWLAPQQSFLWVVRPQGVQPVILPPAKQIAGLVAEYRSLLENLRDPLESENRAGKKLSEILLGPIKEDLRKGVKFVVAPDRDLHSINLEALPDPNDPTRYLIETVSLSVTPSLTMLASRERGAKPARGSLLMIGNSDSPSPEYPRLPYASKEMELISQSFPNHPMVLSGPAAIPEAYLKASPGRYSAIHFAVHANASRESPLDSALILSPGPSGYTLTAREIMSVPLHADLVTLSACHSAGARTYSGEGLVGLSWAFLRAGASSVVAGLWDVTDVSTAKLMGDFYARMAAGEPPADALRGAKLKLIHSSDASKKPYYWAPFQLYAGRL
jgi:CHAT domain-containing protein